MKIKFDTHEITPSEARGLIALLRELGGETPVTIRNTVNVTRPGDTPETAIPGGRFDPNYPGVDFRAPAPDGYPVDPEGKAPSSEIPQAPTDAPERDTDGIPWDARIHASTKTTNKDGTWTRRRNTPDETFDKVMAELKAANTAMTMAAAASLTAPIEPPQPTAAEAFTPPASVVIPAHVPAPPVPVPPVPSANIPVLSPTDALNVRLPDAYDAVNDKSAEAVEIMKAVNAKQVPADKLAELVGKAGLKGLAEVFTASIEARRIIAAELAAL